MNKLQIYNLFKENKKIDNGLFLAFEGTDAVGKNTHVTKLTEYLENKGYKVVKLSFPDYDSLIGKVISAYLRGEYGDVNNVPYELICIAYAADRVRLKDQINSYLNNGYIVISDRYTYSNLFTAAKMRKEKRLPFIEWLEEMEFNELGIVEPHYNFYLHVDPEVSIKRIEERGKRKYQKGKEDIHENNKKLLINTSETYLDFANLRDNWIIINQMENNKQKSIEEVFNMIKKEVNKILKNIEMN